MILNPYCYEDSAGSAHFSVAESRLISPPDPSIAHQCLRPPPLLTATLTIGERPGLIIAASTRREKVGKNPLVTLPDSLFILSRNGAVKQKGVEAKGSRHCRELLIFFSNMTATPFLQERFASHPCFFLFSSTLSRIISKTNLPTAILLKSRFS